MLALIKTKLFAVRARPIDGDAETVREKMEEVDAFLRSSDADVRQQGALVLYQMPNITYLMVEDDQAPGIIFTVVGCRTASDAKAAVSALVGEGWSIDTDERYQRVLNAIPWIVKGGAVLAIGAAIGLGYWIFKKKTKKRKKRR
jgi:hypothetical protein